MRFVSLLPAATEILAHMLHPELFPIPQSLKAARPWVG